MTARELTDRLLKLKEEDLDKEIIVFDGPSYFTPYKIEVIKDKDGWSKKFNGKILID